MTAMYANENFPRQTVEALRAFGHDVLTSEEAGRANQKIPDEDVLEFATQQGRAVLTHNCDDFKKLHRACAEHGGIIGCTVDKDFAALATRVNEMLKRENPTRGKLLMIYRPCRPMKAK